METFGGGGGGGGLNGDCSDMRFVSGVFLCVFLYLHFMNIYLGS